LGVADTFSWRGLALVVALSTAPVTTTAGTVAAPPSPISTAAAAALVTIAAESTPSAILTTADSVAASSSTSARLARGFKIVLNPGHNGGNASHPGAISRQVPAGFGRHKHCDTTGTATNAGFSEHAFNWDVSLRVRKILQSRGVTVIMTRASDRGVGPCVDQRARIGNQVGVAGVVSIHADGAPSSGMVFTSPRLAALNLATVPATLLEIGNMRNRGDAAKQMSSSGRKRIAAAVANGILRWLGR
jgi:N-acetylmuramoyl-L-alanine amidase